MLIEVKDLRTSFFTPEGEVRAVDGVSFEVAEGKTLGLVGESGCGKSVTALSIMRLVPSPPGKVVGGRIVYRGQDLLKLNGELMRRIRGNEISMIFQEPMTSLNPVYTVGNQIAEVIALHQKLSPKQAMAGAAEMLRLVNIPNPQRRVHDYPHQFSGGMSISFSTERAVTVLPQPDSPTTPTVSPRSMRRSTPSTARTIPSSVLNQVFRLRMSSRVSCTLGIYP